MYKGLLWRCAMLSFQSDTNKFEIIIQYTEFNWIPEKLHCIAILFVFQEENAFAKVTRYWPQVPIFLKLHILI